MALQRRAQWRLDFIAAENDMGLHSPQDAARVLVEASTTPASDVEVQRPSATGTLIAPWPSTAELGRVRQDARHRVELGGREVMHAAERLEELGRFLCKRFERRHRFRIASSGRPSTVEHRQLTSIVY